MAQITGVLVRATVPDAILEQADIDAPYVHVVGAGQAERLEHVEGTYRVWTPSYAISTARPSGRVAGTATTRQQQRQRRFRAIRSRAERV